MTRPGANNVSSEALGKAPGSADGTPIVDRTCAAPQASKQSVKRLTEAQLTAIWRGRRFPAGALVTRQGVPVTVIYQGREGRGPGPDFRGAVIAGPSALTLRGDVELHVRASSFHAHGHDRDPAYSDVILHVVFEDDVGADTLLRGRRRCDSVPADCRGARAVGPRTRRRARTLALAAAALA